MVGLYESKMALDVNAGHQSLETDQFYATSGFVEPSLLARTHKTALPIRLPIVPSWPNSHFFFKSNESETRLSD